MSKRRAVQTQVDGGPVGMPALADAPWYVKLVIWLLVWFGFPVAVSMFLLMIVVGYIPSPITTLDKNMTAHLADMQKVMTVIESTQRVQRQICRNTSTNLAERVVCDQ